jgi:glycosyltransferase involved in cell wall biosynthesis
MVKEKSKVTIAIPAYNSEKTLAESILSAKSQDYPDKEILVYDDGSTDSTNAIAKDHGCRIVHRKMNCGIGVALETLMKEANGNFFVIEILNIFLASLSCLCGSETNF